MAGEIRAGSFYEVFYHEETTDGTIYGTAGGDTGDYVALGIISGANIEFKSEIIEIKGINQDRVSANAAGKTDCVIDLEGGLTATILTFMGYFESATEKSFSIVFKEVDPAAADYYYYGVGCVFGKLKINCTTGETVQYSITLEGQQSLKSAASPIGNAAFGTSFAAQDGILWTETEVEKIAASGWTNTGIISYLTAWEYDLNYNVVKRWHMNANLYPARVQRTGYNAIGKLTGDYEDTDQLAEVLDNTAGTLKFVFDVPTDSDFMTITGCRFESHNLDIEEWALVEFETPFKGLTAVLTV